ncbi:MAG TPA: S-layer homology domain-containing protein [Candidatus Dorea intestinavium]|nr:S-layer homology domain-containing protein [Candidatus Dorea intestinavium]
MKKKKLISRVLALTMLVQTLGLPPALTAKADGETTEPLAPTITITENDKNYTYYDLGIPQVDFQKSPDNFLRTTLGSTVKNSEKNIITHWSQIAFPIAEKHGVRSDDGKDNGDLDYVLRKLQESVYTHSGNGLTETPKATATNSNGSTSNRNTYNIRYSGLKNANSLSAAQSDIKNSIVKHYREADGTKDEMKDIVDSISDLNDNSEQTVFYQTFGAYKSKEHSGNDNKMGHYKTYAIIYDNFRISPILDAKNMKDSVGEQIIEPPTGHDKTYTTGMSNKTALETTIDQTLASTNTETATSELNGSQKYEFGQSITTSAGFSIGSLFEASVEVGVTASQAIETGWSKGESYEKTMEHNSSASVTLPSYTSALIKHSNVDQKISTEYTCPVSVSYDVTMVSYMKDPHTKDRKTSLITKFTGNAVADLEKRAMFDYPTISDKNNLNWSYIKSYANANMNALVDNRPMNYQGGKFTVVTNMIRSEIEGITPLLPLYEVTTKDAFYEMNMTQDDHIYTNGIPVYGLNSKGTSYYGFDERKGEWELIDGNGNPLAENIASLEYNALTKRTKLIAGDVEGTAYLRYKIDEKTYTTDPTLPANLNPDTATYLKNENVDRAVIELNVSAKPFHGSIQVLGDLDGVVGDAPIKLNDAFDTIVRGEDGLEVNRPVTWEAEFLPNRGVQINGDEISFTEANTFNIRARTSETYSDWIPVVAREARQISSVKLEDKTEPSILTQQSNGIDPVVVDLSLLDIEAFDQYGDPWVLQNAEWKSDSPNVTINGNILTTQTPGTYKIWLEGDGIASNPLTLTVNKKPYIKSITVGGNIPTLHFDNAKNNTFDLSTLNITALDQYGAPIALETGLYKWSFDVGGFATISGNTITAKIQGQDYLTLKYPSENEKGEMVDLVSNKIKLNITPEYYLDNLYYNGGAAGGTEGVAYDLSSIPLIAKNQYDDDYPIPAKEDITWRFCTQNECKPATINQTNKTLTVPTGTLKKGETATVILEAVCDESGKVAKRIPVEFKQQRALDKIKATTKKELTLKNGENAKISDYFSVTGTDQYGAKFDPTNVTWHSDNSKVIEIKDNAILGKQENKETTIYAKSGSITSNKITVKVAKKSVISRIEVDGNPGMATLSSQIDINKLKVTVYDQYGDKISDKDLSNYPAEIRWILRKRDTASSLNNSKKILSVGNKEGVLELTASVVNSGTSTNLAEKKLYIAVSKEKLPNFSDVNSSDWFYSDANYMYARKLMRGTVSGKTFAPYQNMTRAEAVTLLYRIASLDPNVSKDALNATYKNEFKDVAATSSNAWYTKGLAWASQNKIMTGYANGNFGPTDNITREQMVTILYRYAQKYGHDISNGSITLNNFSDKNMVSSFALQPTNWAVGKQIITGKNQGSAKIIAPLDNISRAEVAVVAQRFIDLYDF